MSYSCAMSASTESTLQVSVAEVRSVCETARLLTQSRRFANRPDFGDAYLECGNGEIADARGRGDRSGKRSQRYRRECMIVGIRNIPVGINRSHAVVVEHRGCEVCEHEAVRSAHREVERGLLRILRRNPVAHLSG